MIQLLENIFKSCEIETPSKGFKKIHSNTSRDQCIFLQSMFDSIKPVKSLEIGLAYGISALAILEKHKEKENANGSHIIIEPFPWNGIAEYNIGKEGMLPLSKIYYHKSDEILPKLFYEGTRIQYAYVDTTKVFDTVLTDFYFINKILDTGGIIILDDCGGAWPGVQKVARFIATLPNYKIFATHNKTHWSFKKNMAAKIASAMILLIPFRKKLYPYFNFKTDKLLGVDYSCIAFQKIAEDNRDWKWDAPF